IPSHAVPAANAYDRFVHAGAFALKIAHKSPYTLGSKAKFARSMTHLRALVRELAPAHAELRAGLRLECVHPPIRSIFDPTWQDQGLIRELCRELAGEALFFDKSGQPGRAIETLLDAAEMCAALPKGDGFMGVMTGGLGVCL